MDVVGYREDESLAAVLLSLFAEQGLVMQVDCAGQVTSLAVPGYFCIPEGSLREHVELDQPA